MATFHFEAMASDQLFTPDSNDVIIFSGGSAKEASVVFNPTTAEGDTITVSFEGHSVRFDFGLVNVAANQNLLFADGSHLLIGGPRSERYDGGAGDDGLYGGGGADTLAGHGGDNVLQGNQGDDVLTAEAGADTIYGGMGNDLIVTGLGGAGDRADFAQGNKGDDTIQGGGAGDILLGGQGNDYKIGGLYGVQAYPTNYLIGPDGKVLWRSVGFDEEGLRAALAKAGVK